MEWTAAQVTELTDLWSRGMSASLIAQQMGCTKNAIIGKVRRLNLPQHLTLQSKLGVMLPIRPRGNARRKTERVPRAPKPIRAKTQPPRPPKAAGVAREAKTVPAIIIVPPIAAAWLPLPGIEPVSLVEPDLRHDQCHWPIGARPMMYCGAPVDRHAYCAVHAKMAYRPPYSSEQKTMKLAKAWR